MTDDPISRDHWARLEPLLDAALDLASDQRAAFVRDACAHDPGLLAELQALLRACETNAFLGAPAAVAFAPLLAEPTELIAEQLGAYQIVREIGRGGMATVYLAEDPKHSRQVAVKVLHPHVAQIIGHERFIREIEIAARLSHPYILPLHDSGEAGDDGSILFFVSPFIAGDSLRDLIVRDGRVGVDDVVRRGQEIALALDYAHRQNVIHLDIKPDNVLLQDGHAVIADFGIAHAMSSAGGEVQDTTTLLGTPAYMSPEHAAGRHDIDGRSDIYSLGCVLYEMLTGERPLERGAPSVALLGAWAPAAVVAVVMRAMSPERDDRFDSAGELARALAESMQPSEAPRTRWRTRALAAAVVVVIAIASVIAARGFGQHSTSAAGEAAILSPRSIAVVPFLNTSSDKEQNYFAMGLTEDLIRLLRKSEDLRVATHGSASAAYILRGKVEKLDSTIRVDAQLVRASDGEAVWSEHYDRSIDEVWAIQAEIAENAVKSLKTTLLASALTANPRSRNSRAYNHVLRGRYFLKESTKENFEQAVECFRLALTEDPRNAAAYAGLARAYRMQAGFGWMPIVEGYAKSRAAAQRAIALDPQLADGYEALAYVQSAFDWDWDAAEASYARALALEPGNADVLRSVALLMAKLGRYDEAIVGIQKAIERDPFSGAYSNLSYVLGVAGRWDEAEAAARTSLALGPNSALRHFNLARALVFRGKNSAALREVELEKAESWRLMGLAIVNHSLGRRAESDSALAEYEAKFAAHSAMQIADVYAYRGETAAAFTWLDRAYEQHDPGIADVKNDPWLANIRTDARYATLLRRMHLAASKAD